MLDMGSEEFRGLRFQGSKKHARVFFVQGYHAKYEWLEPGLRALVRSSDCEGSHLPVTYSTGDKDEAMRTLWVVIDGCNKDFPLEFLWKLA